MQKAVNELCSIKTKVKMFSNYNFDHCESVANGVCLEGKCLILMIRLPLEIMRIKDIEGFLYICYSISSSTFSQKGRGIPNQMLLLK